MHTSAHEGGGKGKFLHLRRRRKEENVLIGHPVQSLFSPSCARNARAAEDEGGQSRCLSYHFSKSSCLLLVPSRRQKATIYLAAFRPPPFEKYDESRSGRRKREKNPKEAVHKASPIFSKSVRRRKFPQNRLVFSSPSLRPHDDQTANRSFGGGGGGENPTVFAGDRGRRRRRVFPFSFFFLSSPGGQFHFLFPPASTIIPSFLPQLSPPPSFPSRVFNIALASISLPCLGILPYVRTTGPQFPPLSSAWLCLCLPFDFLKQQQK